VQKAEEYLEDRYPNPGVHRMRGRIVLRDDSMDGVGKLPSWFAEVPTESYPRLVLVLAGLHRRGAPGSLQLPGSPIERSGRSDHQLLRLAVRAPSMRPSPKAVGSIPWPAAQMQLDDILTQLQFPSL